MTEIVGFNSRTYFDEAATPTLFHSALIPRDVKEGNVLFNDALNTFYLRLYSVRYMVKDHSDNDKGNTWATLID